MKAHKNAWIRLAVNRHAWDKKKPTKLRWRVFVDPSLIPVFVKECVIEGRATSYNFKTPSLTTHDERDVIAWVQLYGNVTFKRNVALITLKPVKT